MVILKNDVDLTDPAVIKDILKYDYGVDMDTYDPDGDHSNNTTKVPNDYAQSIINSLNDRFPDSGSSGLTTVGPVISGDYDSFLISTEADSSAGNADSAADSAAE